MLINIAYINKPGMGIQGRSERLIIGVYEGSVGGGGGQRSSTKRDFADSRAISWAVRGKCRKILKSRTSERRFPAF